MRRFVEYVTTNKSRSSSSEVNQTNVHNYFKPNGLYGFVQVPDTNVSEPGVHNSEATEEESAFFKAEAYILYHIDHDADESIDIVDQGVGMNSNATLLKFFLAAENSVKVSGRGYRPTRANLTYSSAHLLGALMLHLLYPIHIIQNNTPMPQKSSGNKKKRCSIMPTHSCLMEQN